ncbi:MAG: DNA primase [Terriglobales bacterium]
MANPGDFSYTVKQQADIVAIVGEYIKLKKTGAQNFTGLCPFHSEKTGSFSVHATRQFYHCFGCGESGDVFKFIQKIENITFPEAVRLVAQKLGIPVPKATYSSPVEAQHARQRGLLLDIQERACAFFQEQLRRPEGAHAREYLANRGLNEETIARFRIGYAPDSGFLLRDRLRADYDEEILKASGLFSWKEPEPVASSTAPRAESRQPTALYSKFRNRVTFPICNESGKIIAFTGRTLASDEKSGPKYLNSPETPIYSKSHVLFNLDKAKEDIRKAGYAILVEGQMDCISVFAAGIHHVIASSGTAFTEAQARLLGRFTKTIVVNFDPDAAGAAAAERSLGLLVAEDFQIRVVTLETGFDPDLFIRKRGAKAYADVIRAAPKYFDYLIERARAAFPRSAEGKAKAVNYLLPHIQRVPSRIVRDELANEIAQKLGIDSAVLRRELKYAATTRSSASVKFSPQTQITPAERVLVRALASETQLLAEVSGSSRNGHGDSFDPGRQARFVLGSERLHEGLATESLVEAMLRANSVDISDLPLNETERGLAAEILMHEEQELTPELLESAIHALRQKKHVHSRQSEITAQIAEAEKRQDAAALARLMREKLELDRSLAAGR